MGVAIEAKSKQKVYCYGRYPTTNRLRSAAGEAGVRWVVTGASARVYHVGQRLRVSLAASSNQRPEADLVFLLSSCICFVSYHFITTKYCFAYLFALFF